MDDNFGRWLWKMSVNDDGNWRQDTLNDRKSRKLENGSPRLEVRKNGSYTFWEPGSVSP